MVDLFAGPGGMDLGALAAGVSRITGVELDEQACATRAAVGLGTLGDGPADVCAHGPDAVAGARLLGAGPPCQTFSVAGTGTGRGALAEVIEHARAVLLDGRDPAAHRFADSRTALVCQPLRWVRQALETGTPYLGLVFEQARAVEPLWAAVAAMLGELGYEATSAVVAAERYGVPQTRRRSVLLARFANAVVPGAQPLGVPVPTHLGYGDHVAPGLRPWLSQGRALGVDEPFEVISNYGTGGDPRRRGRRNHDQPSATVTGKITRNRVVFTGSGVETRFTDAQAGVLQGFPADYPWSGVRRAQQVGNAMPPPLARACWETVLAGLTVPTVPPGTDAPHLSETKCTGPFTVTVNGPVAIGAGDDGPSRRCCVAGGA